MYQLDIGARVVRAVKFVKMEGLGNDYLFLNCLEGEPPDLPRLATALSDRHFGVGADGLICVKPGWAGDFAMEMYNADGSRGAMCGNGIRCLGKFVYDSGLTRKRCLTIQTDAGPRGLELSVQKGQAAEVTVDMGPAKVEGEVYCQTPAGAFWVTPVDVGNPHGVVFCPEWTEEETARVGPMLEVCPPLGQRRNIEFLTVEDRERLTVRVWERGSGVTLACGTGACASFAAARRRVLCGRKVQVRLPGGVLQVEEREGRLLMTGPARTVFRGEIDLPWPPGPGEKR
mgnify:FL=1